MSKRGTYIYVVRPPRPTFVEDATEAETATISRHFSYAEDLVTSGLGVLVGRTEGGEFGVVIFEAESEEKAREIANNDPAVLEKLFTADLYPFRVALQRTAVPVAL